jgi:hypothetical protein
MHSPVEEGELLAASLAGVPDSWIPQPASTLQASKIEAADDADPEVRYPAYATSRLAGIRKLLISLGRKSLAQDADLGVQDPDFEPRFERATVRPAFAKPGGPEVEAAESKSTSPARVAVQPEFFRPRAASETEREKEPLRPNPQPLRDKPDSQEEIETLPSVRGQYRRKKYSPL